MTSTQEPDPGPTPPPMTLRDVARAVLDAHPGVSGRGLARIAHAQGLSLSYTTVNHLAAGTYNSRPTPQTLETLAALSGLPRDHVWAAAELPLPQSAFADQLPPHVDQLTPGQRAAVLAVIRQFLNPTG